MQERWYKSTRRRNNSQKAALKTDAIVRMSQGTIAKMVSNPLSAEKRALYISANKVVKAPVNA